VAASPAGRMAPITLETLPRTGRARWINSRSLADGGVEHLGRIVGVVRDAHVFLHGPRAHLVVQWHIQGFVAGDGQGLLEHVVAFGLVHLGLHGFGQGVHFGVADPQEVEVAIRAGGAGHDQGLQGVLRIVSGHAPAQQVSAGVKVLDLADVCMLRAWIINQRSNSSGLARLDYAGIPYMDKKI